MSEERKSPFGEPIVVDPVVFDYVQLQREKAAVERMKAAWKHRNPFRKALDLIYGKELVLPQIAVKRPNNILADLIIGRDVTISINCPNCMFGQTEPQLVPCSFGQEITRVIGFCPCCYGSVEADICFCLS